MHDSYLRFVRRTCPETALSDFSPTPRRGHITYGPAWGVIWTRGADNTGGAYRGLAGQAEPIPGYDVVAWDLFLPRRRRDRDRRLPPGVETGTEELAVGVTGPSCLAGVCPVCSDAVHSMMPIQYSSLGWHLLRWSSADTRVSSRSLRTSRGSKRKLRNVQRRRIRSRKDG